MSDGEPAKSRSRKPKRQEGAENKQPTKRKREPTAKRADVEKIVGSLERIVEQLDRQANEDSPAKKSERRWQKAEVLGLWAAAFIGVAAISVASWDSDRQRTALIGQQSVMRGQLSTMEAQFSAAKNSERARFFFATTGLSRKGDDDPAPVFSYTLVNLGRSGALVIESSIECIVTTPAVPNELVYNRQKSRSAMSAVGPSAAFNTGTTCTPDAPVSPADYAAIADKSKIFLLFGFIRFQDVYGDAYRKRLTVYGYLDGNFFPVPQAQLNAEIKE